MFNSIKKYKYYEHKKYKRLLAARIFSLLLLLSGIIILIVAFSTGWIDVNAGNGSKAPVEELWNDSKFLDVIDSANDKLNEHPYNFEALTYRGFSYYYQSDLEPEEDVKNTYLDKSISDLKKVIASGSVIDTSKIDYILGKAFFQKGDFYYDEVIYYLKKSLDKLEESGYDSKEINYILGLSYFHIGDYDNSIAAFKQTMESGEKSRLIIAVTEYNKGDLDTAYRYLDELVNSTEDKVIKNTCLYWIAKVYLDKKEYYKAIEIFNRIIKENPDSADAYYYLGIIYKRQNNLVKARAAFRSALNINSSHSGAFREGDNL
jgi:tetratricopeptide (TPR) repeat protein